MKTLETYQEIVDYPTLDIWPADTAYYINVGPDYDETPSDHHVCMTFYTRVKDWRNRKPSGNDEHYHVPLYDTDARALRDWLNAYLGE